MKKTYQAPELEKIALETEESVTALMGLASNIFTAFASEDEDDNNLINL